MLLVNDRYGLQPFYYWRGPHELVFGSQMKAIAAHPAFKRQVNPLGLADLLATGQMMGEHTLYAGVKALPPATRMLFEAGYLAMETYTRLPFYASGWADHEPKQAVEELDLHVQAALKRCLIPGARLLLSGGLDSRLLAGYLGEIKSGAAYSASSIGTPRSRDVSLGREAAGQAGLPHHVVSVEPTYLRDYAPRCVERTEGSTNAVAAWIFSAEDDLALHPAPAFITGVGAEVITGQHMLAEQNPQNEQDALNWLFNQRWAYNQASALLRPELRPAIAESQDSLARILTRSPEELLSSRLDDFHYRMIRRQPTGSLLSAVVEVREPYFDNDLVDFALRLPPQLRTGGRLFIDLLQLRFPALAEIPGATIPPRASSLQHAWRRMNRRLARAFNFFTGGPYGDDPALPVYYNHWMRTESRSYVYSLLANGDLLGDFCNMRAVRRLLADHMAGRSDSYRLLGALVTFAEWRKRFTS
jgi:asparagine synthetase B (glutamine-hydrolysing)